MKKIFFDVFSQFSIPHFIPLLLNIMFAWKFLQNVSKFCYKHVEVFRDFSVELLINRSYDCQCTSSKRLAQFIDFDTIDDNSSDLRAHVRTMDTKIIHRHGLREAITLCLN